jgi:hypothetical protein
MNTIKPVNDERIAVKQLRYSHSSQSFVESPYSNGKHFVKGPIPLEWLAAVAALEGKCLNVALAIQWLNGMSSGRSFTLTPKALRSLNVSDDTANGCLSLMEKAQLISVRRRAGRRSEISVLSIAHEEHHAIAEQ